MQKIFKARNAMALAMGAAAVLLPAGAVAQGKDKPARVYFIGPAGEAKQLAMFGYDVTQTDGRPTVMAVFRPLPDQPPLDPERFDYITACEALLAAPPVHPNYPKPTAPVQHVLVFAQNVQTGALGLSETVSGSYRELDVTGEGCVPAEPGSLYQPLVRQ